MTGRNRAKTREGTLPSITTVKNTEECNALHYAALTDLYGHAPPPLLLYGHELEWQDTVHLRGLIIHTGTMNLLSLFLHCHKDSDFELITTRRSVAYVAKLLHTSGVDNRPRIKLSSFLSNPGFQWS